MLEYELVIQFTPLYWENELIVNVSYGPVFLLAVIRGNRLLHLTSITLLNIINFIELLRENGLIYSFYLTQQVNEEQRGRMRRGRR